MFSLYKPTVKQVTSGAGPFLGPGTNMNKLGGGPLGDATYQRSTLLGLVVYDEKIFHDFPI